MNQRIITTIVAAAMFAIGAVAETFTANSGGVYITYKILSDTEVGVASLIQQKVAGKIEW